MTAWFLNMEGFFQLQMPDCRTINKHEHIQMKNMMMKSDYHGQNIVSGTLRDEVMSSSRYKKWIIEDQIVRILYME